ncbi:MAG: hypothetical protein K2X03_13965 [Bryobacteraceae bacterium]|nr:hypothetical protein [Bryobacteraceae bacterium]
MAKTDPAAKAYAEGLALIQAHPLFSGLQGPHRQPVRREGVLFPAKGWAYVFGNGAIHVHPHRRGSPQNWAYVIAHALLHLAFGHLQHKFRQREWDLACDVVVHRFLTAMRFGTPPDECQVDLALVPVKPEAELHAYFCREGISSDLLRLNLTGTTESDMQGVQTDLATWERRFSESLRSAVTAAVDQVAGAPGTTRADQRALSPGLQRAREWFINHYPLLGSMVVAFEFIEDPQICRRSQISIAAVNPYLKEIYINPGAGLRGDELRFVVAHEILHAALRHDVRRESRDPYLWNIACDYVINLWLREMEIGRIPERALYDETLRGLSAESVYDLIVTDLRRYRKLITMRGYGLTDVIDDEPGAWLRGEGVTLDEFYRGCLAQGLAWHQDQGRGYLPAGLVEEIRALAQPPIPWDVKLAQWFDHFFPALAAQRTYARPSRRQGINPEIPMPRYVPPPDREARTFGVVLDTSGSMDRALLGNALGAIASYAISRDVALVRLVCCDAAAYDQGYVAPEMIADRIRLRGRGGTVLQPGIDLIERSPDFPKLGPVLLITDGQCDHFSVARPHAILLPRGSHLPFAAHGPIFYLK